MIDLVSKLILGLGSLTILACTTGKVPIVIDHQAVDDFNKIPDEVIEKIKTQRLLVHYPGQSHSLLLGCGLRKLAAQDPKYAVQLNSDLSELTGTNTLRVLRGQWDGTAWNKAWGTGEENYWATAVGRGKTEGTVQYAAEQGEEIAISFFGWCWDIIRPNYCFDENNQRITFNDERMTAYLNAVAGFNANLGINKTRFVYVTGPTDDDYWNAAAVGEDGVRVTKYNNAIRQAAKDNNGILFDYADIENWNNSNTEQRIEKWNGNDLYLMHGDYNKNIEPNDCSKHTHANNAHCIRMAKALWVLMARLAGWEPH